MQLSIDTSYSYGKWLGARLGAMVASLFAVATLLLLYVASDTGELSGALVALLIYLGYMTMWGIVPATWIGFVTGWFIESCARYLLPYLNRWRLAALSASICTAVALLVFWQSIVQHWPSPHTGMAPSNPLGYWFTAIPLLYVAAGCVGGYRLMQDLQVHSRRHPVPPGGVLDWLMSAFFFAVTVTFLTSRF